MSNYGRATWKLQIHAIVIACATFGISATIPLTNRPSNPSIYSPDPHYRFHYLTERAITDNKTHHQEELRKGDINVTGSLMPVEPNGNLAVDTTMSAQQNAAFPAKLTAFAAAPTAPAFGVNMFNNYYRGGSFSTAAAIRNHKFRGLNPIVVKPLLPAPPPPPPALASARLANLTPDLSQIPYPFYREGRNESSTFVQGANVLNSIKQLVLVNTTTSTTNVTAAAEKSETSILENLMETKSLAQSTSTLTPLSASSSSVPFLATVTPSYNLQSLGYFDSERFKSIDNVRVATETNTIPASHGVNQLHKMDVPVPLSVIEIMNLNKAQQHQLYSTDGGKTFLLPTVEVAENSVKTMTETNKMNDSLPPLPAVQKDRTSIAFVPPRPMRLIGLNPMFVDTMQLQSISENLTIPQFHWEPMSNIHYVAPIPLQHAGLPFGPAGPFHNVPRSVNEPSAETPLTNQIPLLNSIAISAPIVPPPPPPTLPSADIKSDAKTENKPMSSPSFLLCNDCTAPSNYVTYPLLRLPSSGSAPLSPASSTLPLLNSIAAPFPNVPAISPPQPSLNVNGQKAPCTNTAAAAPSPPLWTSYPPSLAYILLPTPYLKNKLNDTRTLPFNAFT